MPDMIPIPPIDLSALSFVGSALNRPECVLATADGVLLASDWSGQGGVTRIAPDGSQQQILASGSFTVRPNGIALRRDGSLLLAHLGAEDGGVYRLARDGLLTPLFSEAEGQALPPTNFVTEDPQGRVWATVSTRQMPRDLGYRRDLAEGFILLYDQGQARVVADGLGYTNEIGFDATGDWLYVNETFARRLTRFRVAADGRLSGRETFAAFGEGTFPDGLAFDAEGAVWIVSIVSNRVIRITPDGRQETLLEESDPDHLAWVEDAYRSNTLGRPHLDRIESRLLRNISSLAFGGPDLKTVYLGCLLGDRIARFRSPVAGRPLPHWHHPG